MILCCWRKSCVLRSRREIRQCTASVTFTYASVKAWENLNETACYRRNPASYLKLKHAGQMVIVVAVTESVFQRCKQFHINWSKNFESKFQTLKLCINKYIPRVCCIQVLNKLYYIHICRDICSPVFIQVGPRK